MKRPVESSKDDQKMKDEDRAQCDQAGRACAQR
jgi:hypothetical protein